MSHDEGGQSLACMKCRNHRVKCDRLRPVCSRCSRLGHSCIYPDRSPATAYVKYVRELESRVAALEQQLLETDSMSSVTDLDNRRGVAVTGNEGRLARASSADHLIDDLFAQPTSTGAQSSKVKTLVDGLAQVSLAAMTPHGMVARTQDTVLRSLILSASLPPAHSHINQLSYLELPRQQIAERVCARYCDDILPAFPSLTAEQVHYHCQNAYKANSAYSCFVTATILATTAIVISPGSIQNAASLYFYGLSCLETAMEEGSGCLDDILLDLEVVMLLGHFGSLAGDTFSDPWALSGLGIRIAVDLGLHKAVDTDRKRRLFWAAYILDRKCAVARNKPLGLPDEAIATPSLALARNSVELFRIMSEVYKHAMSGTVPLQHAYLRRLDSWEERSRLEMTSLPHVLSQDIALIRDIIASNSL